MHHRTDGSSTGRPGTAIDSTLWPSGRPATHEIVAAARPAEARAHITAALSGLTGVRFLPSLAAWDGPSDATEPLLALLYLDGQDVATDVPGWSAGLRAFRERWAAVPVVAYACVSPGGMRQCHHAGLAGVGEILLRGYDDVARALTPRLERRSADPMIRVIIHEIISHYGPLQPEVVRILRYALEHVRDAPCVDRLAHAVDVPERTMTRHLHASGLPSAQRLLVGAKLLVLAWLLRDPDCSINRASMILHFASTSALRHTVARHLGQRADRLRAPDGLTCVVRHMLRPTALEHEALVAGSHTPWPVESLPAAAAHRIIAPA